MCLNIFVRVEFVACRLEEAFALFFSDIDIAAVWSYFYRCWEYIQVIAMIIYVACAAGFCYLLYHLILSGLFKFDIEVDEEEIPKLRIAYKNYVGEYKTAGQHFKSLVSAVKSKTGFNPDSYLGVYFDDPTKVKPSECRFTVAVVLDDDGAENPLKEDGYKEGNIIVTNALHATFPFYGIVSILLAISRVYPALTNAATAKSLEGTVMIELSHISKHLTDYYFPFGKNAGQFYSLVDDLKKSK